MTSNEYYLNNIITIKSRPLSSNLFKFIYFHPFAIKMLCFLLQVLLYLFLSLPVFFYVKDLRLYHGSVSISSPLLKSTVDVFRDEHDIPHIQAKTLHEAFFGLGYVHAQDRLFSMSIKRLIFSGRLSEFFGDSFLEMDTYYRNLLLMHSCKENLRNMDSDDREHFEYYIAGLNEFADRLWFLPNEFYIMGLPYERFKIEDGLVLWKFLGFALTFDWQHEIFREKLAEVFGEEAAEEMAAAFGQFHFDKTVVLNDEELKQSGIYDEYKPTPRNRTRKISPHNFSHHAHPKKYVHDVLYDMMDTIDNMARGSNNWVIHGNLTKSGRPIMANDPHLDNHMPCLWYLVELIYDNDEKYVIGATLPGLPFIFVGRTQFMSMGATTLHTDSADIYREVLSTDGTQYLYEGKYYDLEVIREEIKVKEGESRVIEIKKTRHGPIMGTIQDIYNVEYDIPNANISFAWIGYNPKDTTFKTLISIYKLTSNTSEINRIFGGFTCPFMNIVYATESGDIGYYAVGWLPMRANPEVPFFLEGDKKENDWLGIIGNKDTPQIINPKKGYIVTANNKMATDNLIFRKSIHMLPSSRAMRIDQMIRGYIDRNQKISIEDIIQMQADVKDPYAEYITPKMLDLVDNFKEKLGFNHKKVEILSEMVSNMRTWDFKVEKDSVAACIFNYWEYKFLNRLLGRIPDNIDRERIVFSLNFEQFIIRKLSQFHSNTSEIPLSTHWSENTQYPVPNQFQNLTCIYHLLDSLFDAHNLLSKALGPVVSQWQWGKMHQMKYRHVPFSDLPFGWIYEKEFPADGNRRTVNVAIPNFRTHELDGVHSANLRVICEMGGEGLWSFDTGVSENRLAWNYVEGMETHRRNRYWKMRCGKEEVGGYERRLSLKGGER